MLNADETFRLPDWTDERAYDHTTRLARREWAWEFLRRNPAFRTAWRAAQLEYGLIGYDGGTTMILSQHRQPSLEEWGLLFATAPDQDASLASAFWSPSLCSRVLRLTAFPLSARVDATPFLLRDMSCASVLLEIPEGPQHLLFADNGRGLQLVIEGADVSRPVRLMTNCAPDADLAGGQLSALYCFNNLRLTGRLHISALQRDPLTPRLRLILRALDGSLSGASFQEIARAVFPSHIQAEGWQKRAGGLRDRVRRAVQRGHYLMNGGYRTLLS